jgi:hypothetical protein
VTHTGGRKAEPVREAWAMRFNLTRKQRASLLDVKMCQQLCMCLSDEARRLLLGVSQ